MLLNFYNNFLGESPKWYKNLIILFLVSNPLIYIFLINIGSEAGFIMGWIILAQFILTLAMALNCYPLQPGGLIAIQSVLMGLTNTKNIYHEVKFLISGTCYRFIHKPRLRYKQFIKIHRNI